MFQRKGQLFILSAPSGTGKTTLSGMLLSTYKRLSYSVSYTTRGPRACEKNGVEYYFTDEKTFKKMIERGDFVEYARVHDCYYGTSAKAIEDMLNDGKDVLLDIDPQGAMQIKSKFSGGVFIFIMPPSMQELKSRLIKRDDNTQNIELRLNNAEKEISCAPNYEYIIVNDDLDAAYQKLEAIYIAETNKTKLMKDLKI